MYNRLCPMLSALFGLAIVSSSGVKLPFNAGIGQQKAVAKAEKTTKTNEPAKSVSEPIVVPKLVAMNARIARRVNALRPTVKERLQRVVEKLPDNVTILVTSAYRTREEQASLTSTFGVKARPGTSTHEDGRGIDLNVFVDGKRVPPRKQQRVIGKVMTSEGFRHLGPSDPVHYSIPKWEMDKSKKKGPELLVGTYDEFMEIQRRAAESIRPAEKTASNEARRDERVALDQSGEHASTGVN